MFGNCEFIFDQRSMDYDWLVVYDDLPIEGGARRKHWEEVLPCPRSHTLLVTTEPASIKPYGQGFMRQFGYVLTSQEPWCVRHSGAIFSQAGLIWFYGDHGHGASYDELSTLLPGKKILDLSTVCSSKRQSHTLHNDRYIFTQKLKQALPDMDIFGHGIRFVKNKADAIDPYRYHLAIENHVCDHHWTEKLADCYLGYSLPFYYGCPNVGQYFPPDSLIKIDIYDLEASVERIRKAIAEDEYHKRLPAIMEARRLFLEKYCTFALLSRLIEDRNEPGIRESACATILSRHAWRRSSPLRSVAFGFEKGYFLLRHQFHRHSSK